CPAFAAKIIAARDGEDVEVGNLKVRRDFCDVRDIVRAYRLIIQRRPREKRFVLGTGRAVALETIFDHFVAMSGKTVGKKQVPSLMRIGEPAEMIANPTLARNVLDWSTEIPLEATLRMVYDSVKSGRQ